MYPTFKSFLQSNWWFLMLGLAKAINNGKSSDMTGYIIVDVSVLSGFLLLIMFIYWFVRYRKNK